MTWIPVTERLPDDGVEALVLDFGLKIHIGRFISHGGWRVLCSPESLLLSESQVTHWMPLPDPPPRKLTHWEALEKAVAALEAYKDGGGFRGDWCFDGILPELKAALA